MATMRSLTVLCLRSGASADDSPPAEALDLVRARGGEARGRRERTEIWTFLSPTEAVLAGLDAASRAPGAGVAVGIAIGEVEAPEGSATATGEPVDDALALCVQARPRWVLFSKATSLAVNHNEVGGEPAGWFEVPGRRGKLEAFRAFRGPDRSERPDPATVSAKVVLPTVPASPPVTAPPVAAPPANSLPGLVLALLVGAALARFLGPGSGAPDAAAQAAASMGRTSQAIELALAGLATSPGDSGLVDLLVRLGLVEKDRHLAAGRPDRALTLLRRLRGVLPPSDLLDGALLDAGAAQIRQFYLGGRTAFADEEEARLARELPHQSARLREVLGTAVLDRLAAVMDPVIAERERVPFDTVKEWNDTLTPVEKEFPRWGRIRLLWGRMALANGRYDDMGRLFTEAVRLTPTLAEDRTVLADVRRAAERTTYRAADTMANAVAVLAESLGDWVVPELVPWLAERHSVVRTTAYRALKARGALPADRLMDYHLMNLGLVCATSEKDAQIDAPELFAALDYLGSLTEPSARTRARQALQSLPGPVMAREDVSARVASVLSSLTAR